MIISSTCFSSWHMVILISLAPLLPPGNPLSYSLEFWFLTSAQQAHSCHGPLATDNLPKAHRWGSMTMSIVTSRISAARYIEMKHCHTVPNTFIVTYQNSSSFICHNVWIWINDHIHIQYTHHSFDTTSNCRPTGRPMTKRTWSSR